VHPSLRRGLVAASLLLGLASCGDGNSAYDAPATTRPSTTDGAAPAEGEPPGDFESLAALFGPVLDGAGLDLTRASVAQLETGPHVALYGVPPAGEDGPSDYLARLVPSVAAAGAVAFDGFSAVQSFDICQEPTATSDEGLPPPVTVVVLTRAQWESVPDWTEASLVDLLRAASLGDGGQVDVPDEVGALDEWQTAVDEFRAGE
jgi:hypothetical protein